MTKSATCIKSGVERELPYTVKRVLLKTNQSTKDVRVRVTIDSSTGLLELELS